MNDEQNSEEIVEPPSRGQSGENESLLILLDELEKSPSQFAKTVINEIKALQSRYVLLRLDRDNWRKDYEHERSLADRFFDCLTAYKNGTAEEPDESRKREVVMYEYDLKRRGIM